MTPSDLLCLSLLLTQLESPRFTERDRAARALDTMGHRAVPALTAAAPNAGRDAQQHIARILDRRRGEHLRAIVGLGTEVPWIDSLPLDYPNRRDVIQQYLAAVDYQAQGHAEPWSVWRAATAAFVSDQLAAGANLGDVAELLGRMRERVPKWDGGKWIDQVEPMEGD